MTTRDEIISEAQFLVDRLNTFDLDVAQHFDSAQATEWCGHVVPSWHRLKALLAVPASDPARVSEAEIDAARDAFYAGHANERECFRAALSAARPQPVGRALFDAIDSPCVRELSELFANGAPSGKSYSQAIVEILEPRLSIQPAAPPSQPVHTAVAREREECAKMLELSDQEIRLGAGEMTAAEMRSVKAVLKWRAFAIRARAALSAADRGPLHDTRNPNVLRNFPPPAKDV